MSVKPFTSLYKSLFQHSGFQLLSKIGKTMQLCFGQTVVRTGAGHPADEEDVAIMAFDILGCYRYF